VTGDAYNPSQERCARVSTFRRQDLDGNDFADFSLNRSKLLLERVAGGISIGV
jgi:hypothetical protein